MNSKEALNNIEKLFIGSPINPTKQFGIIEKDLEILDILKKHYDNNSLALSLNSFIVFTIHNDDKDFHKIKEWLENGKNN